MLLAYVDESGNTGDVRKGGSLTFSLGCVLIDADVWPAAFETMLDFRRRLKATYRLPMRAEVKANYLLRSSGPLRDLSLAPAERGTMYRAHMRILNDLPARAFAVVVDKGDKEEWAPSKMFAKAWTLLMERLERTSTKEDATFMVVHDHGEDDAIRRLVRRARRRLTAGSAYGTGSLDNPARLLVDDPVPRSSHHAYFVQCADLVAYAGFRAQFDPSPAVAAVCPASMWDEMGDARHSAVAGLKPRSHPGIVLR